MTHRGYSRHLKIWKEGAETWHSFYVPGTRDMMMGILRDYEVERVIERARKNGLIIEDKRGSK